MIVERDLLLPAAEHVMQTLQLNTRLSNKSWVRTSLESTTTVCPDRLYQLGDEDSDEEDPFAEVCRIVSTSTLTLNLES